MDTTEPVPVPASAPVPAPVPVPTPAVHWSTQLRELLQGIEPLGSFVHTQCLTDLPSLLPHVTVDGVGRLGFPIVNVSVRELIASSVKAPYGMMDQTLMDPKVRDAWEIDADKVTIGNSDQWLNYFNKTVRQLCFQLGISTRRFDKLGIQANLYKMLIYETEGHFLTHRDTEKEPHMFGTLILQLPTSDGFQGGEFTVSHRGVTKSVDLSIRSDDEFHTVVFYADCEHELHPITKGTRVCLVYNLVATIPVPENNKTVLIPSNAINIDTENQLRSIWNEWCEHDLNEVTKIGDQLEHKYTRQSISFSTLKGRDEIVAATLRNARNVQGHRLFRVSILLMEQVYQMSGQDLAGEYSEPYILIEETADGCWERKDPFKCTVDQNTKKLKSDGWDMKCHSEWGWWVMPNVEITNAITGHIQGDNDDKEELMVDDGCFELKRDRQMFLFACDKDEKIEPYCGNGFGNADTFYYAAAIVISPIQDPERKIA